MVEMEGKQKQNLPVLARTEILFLGESVGLVEKAAAYRKQERAVLIAAPFYSFGNWKENGIRSEQKSVEKCLLKETPDEWKKRAEEICSRFNIELLYGIREIGEYSNPETEGKMILVAAKSGIYAILCKHVIREYEVQESMRENGPSCGIYVSKGSQISLWKRNERFCGKNEAVQLLQLEEDLLTEFVRCKKKEPELRLGRFAFHKGNQIRNFSDKDGSIEYENVCSRAEMKGGFSKDFLQWNGKIKAAALSCDVLVAGGGTAGAMAALYAARTGANTILLEGCRQLGGTAVEGGVGTYWFGNRFQDVEEINKEIQKESERCNIRMSPGIWGECDAFHSGLKGHVLLRLCLREGVTILLGQTVCGVKKEGGRVTGTLSAGDGGNFVVTARQIIDATGDGDLAVLAEAHSEYGSDRDCITYWGSLAQYTGIDSYQNNFASMYMESDPWDVTRFIRIGRKRGGTLFDHGSLVCTRESRHIRGKYQVDLRDLCTFRQYEDGVYTCYSNYDPKGKLDADMVYCGWLVPQMQIQIPLSALLPVDEKERRIEGLYVAGKAISATHNAFPSIRMQADLMHQGAVIGILAAEAVQRNCDVDDLSPEEYRVWIKKRTGDDLTLPDVCEADRKKYVWKLTKNERTTWIDVPFLYAETQQSSCLALVTAEKEEVEDELRRRLKVEKEESIRRMLCRLLLWHGGKDMAEKLERALLENLKGDCLPVRTGSTMCAQLLPDHGVMPETVYDLNLLSLSGNDFSMKPFARVMELLKNSERDYGSITKGIYHYIESFAYAAQHSGKKEFLPFLTELKQFPELKQAFHKETETDLISERLQILWFLLSRAQAGLGEREGYVDLIWLLEAKSRSVAVSAAMALRELAVDAGKESIFWNKEDWKKWLERTEVLPVRVWKEKRW